jgi:hypothetical protein
VSTPRFTWEVQTTPHKSHRPRVAHAFDERGNSACGIIASLPADQRQSQFTAPHDSRKCSRCEDVVARVKLNRGEPSHTLVVIGFLGDRTAYLDMSPADAMVRHRRNGRVLSQFECPGCGGPNHPAEDCPQVKVIEFVDEFHVYDASEA